MLESGQISALSKLFSPSIFKELAIKGESAVFARLLTLARIDSPADKANTVGDAFETAFSLLKAEGRRDEYVYRNAIVQKILMGKHSLRTASMMAEFRAGECKADLVILNGTATAYEIKSERDSLGRLAHQVSNYRKVFAATTVIASAEHIDAVASMLPKDVGILQLSDRYRIQTVRDPIEDAARVDPAVIFDSLRVNEAKQVLGILGVETPNVPNTRIRGELRGLFVEQNPASIHRAMVTVLKKTRTSALLIDAIEHVPYSLRAVALSVPPKLLLQGNVFRALSTPINIAMRWS